jgi:GT2 family glycosyltransferase
MTEKKVAIIIVNWNGLKFLNDCLSSVYKQTYQNFDVYFVDNGSNDDSVNFVKKYFSRAKIVQLKTNTGFAKGNNEGIKEAFKDVDVEYVVCLNNDTIVDKNWLYGLVELVDLENKIDMVGSLSLLPSGRVYSIGARFNKNLCDLSIGYGQDAGQYTDSREIFAPHGVSALYSRRLLKDVGLFDEDFFAYCEEFDLGLRARNKGYKAVFAPSSKLIHLTSQSSGGMANSFKAYMNKRNSYFVAIKNFSIIDLALYPFRDITWNIINIFSNSKKTSVKILQNKIGILGMIFIMCRVYMSVLINLPKFLMKRWTLNK